MTITEMHVYFRQYAQQMGMQNVRAITPEQIDVMINTSIDDKVKEIIRENTEATNTTLAGDNNKLAQVNSLKTLYTVKELSVGTSSPVENSDYIVRTYDATTNIDVFYLCSLSCNYVKVITENDEEITKYTDYYPVRIIDDTEMANTLHDSILKPDITSPACSYYNNVTDNHQLLTIYFGKKNKNNELPCGWNVNNLRVAYIKKPKEVSYSSLKDSDMPDYLHIPIVKHAVDLYALSVRANGGFAVNVQRQVPNVPNVTSANNQQ